MRRVRAVAVGVLGAGALMMAAGCASQGSEQGSQGSQGSQGPPITVAPPPRITVERSGGFAGLHDTVVLGPDGAWTATDRAGARRGGRLGPAEIAGIRALADDPRVAAEAGRGPAVSASASASASGPSRCSDALRYALTVGSERVDYADCPADAAVPVASAALVRRVLASTVGG